MLEETPVLKNNFAGIGTRHLTLSGLKAINNLFTTTFGEISYKADAKKVSIDSLNRVLVKSEEGVIDKSTLIGSNDMFSYYEQQHNASVGRDNVGIAANGVKVTYALADYNNDFYNTLLRNKENDLPINEELVKTKLFNFVFN